MFYFEVLRHPSQTFMLYEGMPYTLARQMSRLCKIIYMYYDELSYSLQVMSFKFKSFKVFLLLILVSVKFERPSMRNPVGSCLSADIKLRSPDRF